MAQDAPVVKEDPDLTSFYESCSEGNLDKVREYVEISQPPAIHLAYALEEACHNFRLDVVRFLLQQPDTQLHYRCFRRCPDCPNDDIAKGFGDEVSYVDSQSIFTSGDSRLLDLLKVLLEFGWHPNQLLGPPLRGKASPLGLPRQEVALHYPRCILDLDILRFLLDRGADPTIARGIYGSMPWLDGLAEYPVQRLSGDILERAVNLGAFEAVTLLVSKGAKPAYGIPLHSLVRRRPDSSKTKTMGDAYMNELWQEPPELGYPTLSTRLDMAAHLLHHGEDINRTANVYVINPDLNGTKANAWQQIPPRRRILPISHPGAYGYSFESCERLHGLGVCAVAFGKWCEARRQNQREICRAEDLLYRKKSSGGR